MGRRWRGILTGGNFETSDHRLLENVTWRELPLTLRVQTEDFGAHAGASPVASIQLIEPRSVEELRAEGFSIPPEADAAQPYYAEGEFSESEAGALAAQWVEEQVLRGISVDPGAIEYVEELVDPATGEIVPMEQIYETWDQIDAAAILDDEGEQARLIEWLESLYYRIRFTTYEIAAATLLATPAIGWAVIELVGDAEASGSDSGGEPSGEAASEVAEPDTRPAAERLAALTGRPSARQRLSALIEPRGDEQVAAFSPGRMIAAATADRFDPSIDPAAQAEHVRQAAASRLAVARFAPEVFEPIEATGPVKFTITDEGRMLGHLFTWESCHRSFAGARCETPLFLRSDPDFSDFHVGEAALEGGGRVRVGVLTFAEIHAPDARGLSPEQMTQLMENTGTQLGPVRLHVDRFGLQASGQLWADTDPTQAARCLAGFPSYDARRMSGRWRLFGLHVVNTPGHTIYEEQEGELVRMVASLAPTVGPRASAALSGPSEPCACGRSSAPASASPGGSEAPGAGSCGCAGAAGLSPQALAQLAALDEAMATRRRLSRAGA